MRVVQYICEFFFCDFWHFVGLIVLVGLLCPRITINRHEEEKGDKK